MSRANAKLKRRKYGLLSVLAVAAVGAVGCSTTTTESPAAATTPAGSATSTAAGTESPTEVESGCTKPCADDDGWIAEITKVKYGVSSGNEFTTPEPGNVFVTMDVTFVNKTTSSHSASDFDFKLESAGVSRNTEIIGPCESWSPVDVRQGASYGPKCLAFQAKSGSRSGLTVIWEPSLFSQPYEIPVSAS